MEPSRTEPYLMIRSLVIENFRGFRKLHLNDLRRINVLVGANATGKTAFLEGVCVVVRAVPRGVLAVVQNRMLVPFIGAMTPKAFEEFWSQLFYDLNVDEPIHMSFADSLRKTRHLTIKFADRGSVFTTTLTQQQPNTLVTAGSLGRTSLVFVRTHPAGDEDELRSFVGPDGLLQADGGEYLGPISALFPSTTAYNLGDNITWLSDLSMQGQDTLVLELLRREFPKLNSIDVLSPSGQQGIYVSYAGSNRKFPITSVSSGIHKVMTLVLASISYKKGIILIDEIENGLFYERYGEVWRMLHELSRRQDNQVFVTTHSLECLRALETLIQQNPKDFALLRTGHDGEGCFVERFASEELLDALRQDVDPRGREASQRAE